MINWQPLTGEHDMNEIVELSHEKPVMIFKHSTRCGISFSALDKLVEEWNPEKSENLSAYMLDVISHNQFAREIGKFFGIPHQSPQVMIIDQGKVVYEQSHFGIKYSEVEEILGKLNG